MPHTKYKERKNPVDYVPPEKLARFRTQFAPDQFESALKETRQLYAEDDIIITEEMLDREPYRQVLLRILAGSINAELLETEPLKERRKIIAALAVQLQPAPAEN